VTLPGIFREKGNFGGGGFERILQILSLIKWPSQSYNLVASETLYLKLVGQGKIKSYYPKCYRKGHILSFTTI